MFEIMQFFVSFFVCIIMLWRRGHMVAIPSYFLCLAVIALYTFATQRTRHRARALQLDSLPRKKRVVIVGAGVGGLASAARILSSSTNIELHILEKNGFAGGRCGSFWHQEGKFRHERGPSLLLLPHVYEQLFQDVADASIADFGLRIEQCVPAYQAVFEDGDTILMGFPKDPSPDAIEQRTESRKKLDEWEPNGAQKWDEYISICQAYLDAGFPNFIEERLDLSHLPRFVEVCFKDLAKAWPLKPHSDVLDSIFESPKMQALASFQDLYVGLEPYKKKDSLFGGVLTSTAPAVFGLLSAIEFEEGVYAPIGGFSAVTQAMERLTESCGATIHYETSVTKVETDGVHYINQATNSSGFLPADVVIVNADLPYAEKSLFSDNKLNKQYDWNDRYRFSSGVIAFHWSVNRPLDQLSTHNVFLAASNRTVAELSWNVLRENKRQHPAAPFNFYVHCASRTDPSAAPADGEALLVLVPCNTLQRNQSLASIPREEALHEYSKQFDAEAIAAVRRAVLERMQIVVPLTEDDIVEESIETPASYAAKYNVGAGTPFGLSHGFGQLSFFRPAPADILHVGASTRPGNGVPLVLVGAKRIANEALKRLGIR